MRADGYHLIDAEMVTLDLADELTIGERDDGRSSLTVDGPFADGVPTDDRTSCAGRSGLAGRSADVHVGKRIPAGGGLGGGSADAAAVLRWAGVDDPLAAVAARRRRAVLRRRRPGAGQRHRRGGRAAAVPVERTVTLVVPPVPCCTPAVYRAWDELGGPTGEAAQRPRAGGPRGRAPSWLGGATASPS